ncbi:unnamed protein product [Blepharisma stoltei]|uniref:MIF4G domain-containing protein n=1 Tax=Blepharisma stoltei TaxID=1481888 RepID=A0AAU9IVV5_9CILI|nr:unnamed protein product [Blepharisma stoltei]
MSASNTKERKPARTNTSPPDAGQPEFRDYKAAKAALLSSLSISSKTQPEINVISDIDTQDNKSLSANENKEQERPPRKLSPAFKQEEIDNTNEETKIPANGKNHFKGGLSTIEEDITSHEYTPMGTGSTFSQISVAKAKIRYSEDDIRKAGDEDLSWVLPIQIVRIRRRNEPKPERRVLGNTNYKFNWRAEEDETQKKIRQGALENTKKINTEKSTKEKKLCDIKIILNKLTMRNFDKLKTELFEISKLDEEYLEALADAIFQKACFEKKYVGMYADLCKYLTDAYLDFQLAGGKVESSKRTQDSLFRKMLLNVCQESFEEMWMSEADHKGDSAYKVKSLGMVRFIGELFKAGFIPPKVIFMCLMELISPNFKETFKNPDFVSLVLNDDKLEGAVLMLTAGGAAYENEKYVSKTNAVVNTLKEIMDRGLTANSRVKFLILDMLELRACGWQDKLIESPTIITN